MLNFDGAFSIHNRDFKDFPISLQIYYNFSAISTLLANLNFNKHKCHRYLAYCINPYLTVCLGPLLLGFPTRNIYWNFNNLRTHRVLKFAKFWEIHAAPILLKTEQSARCSRRRRAADAYEFFLAPETGSFFFFFVSVWRNRGLAKSVTAAEKNGLVTKVFDGCGQIALTGRFDVEVEDFWVVWAAKPVDCLNPHIVHWLVLQVPKIKLWYITIIVIRMITSKYESRLMWGRREEVSLRLSLGWRWELPTPPDNKHHVSHLEIPASWQ